MELSFVLLTLTRQGENLIFFVIIKCYTLSYKLQKRNKDTEVMGVAEVIGVQYGYF